MSTNVPSPPCSSCAQKLPPTAHTKARTGALWRAAGLKCGIAVQLQQQQQRQHLHQPATGLRPFLVRTCAGPPPLEAFMNRTPWNWALPCKTPLLHAVLRAAVASRGCAWYRDGWWMRMAGTGKSASRERSVETLRPAGTLSGGCWISMAGTAAVASRACTLHRRGWEMRNAWTGTNVSGRRSVETPRPSGTLAGGCRMSMAGTGTSASRRRNAGTPRPG